MECIHCGDTMMRETVISLKRRFIGFRETRSERGYCMRCGTSAPCESQTLLNTAVGRANRGRAGSPKRSARRTSPWPSRLGQSTLDWTASGALHAQHAEPAALD